MFDKLRAKKNYDKAQKMLKREQRLNKLAKQHGGKVIHDSQFGRGVHVSTFHFVTEDGIHIYEWP